MPMLIILHNRKMKCYPSYLGSLYSNIQIIPLGFLIKLLNPNFLARLITRLLGPRERKSSVICLALDQNITEGKFGQVSEVLIDFSFIQ